MHNRNIKLTIEYDGTNYHGWQSQINAVAIQDIIKDAVEKLTGESCKLIGSSRTDVGVHALGQVANFMTSSSIPAERFSYALNHILPDDIVIKKSESVTEHFHAQYSALGKKYRYLIYNESQPSAILRNRTWQIFKKLDIEPMKRAAKYFEGTHDFSAFRSTGSGVKKSIRTISESKLDICEDNILSFEIAGDGFLYNMVRIIVGTLVGVGLGKISESSVQHIIESQDRKKAGKTAPAHGLYLVEVYY